MAVTRTDLVLAYPEFTNAGNARIDALLVHAALSVSEEVFGDSYDLALILWTCHLLTISPFGQEMQLAPASGEDKYLNEYNRLAMSSGQAFRFPDLEDTL